jgi:hypothetical protein
MRRIDSARLDRAIARLPDDPEPDNCSKRALIGDTNIFDVTVDGRTHGVLYAISYTNDTKNNGVVRIKNVLDGYIFRWGYPEGDFRSGCPQ